MAELTVERLESLLRAAERAHGEFERSLGHRDENWPKWYATFLLPLIVGGAADGPR